MRFVAGGATDRGRVREGNEDGYLLEPRLALFAVADGMGGHRGGEVASATALASVREHLRAGPDTDLAAAVHAANRAVRARAVADSALAGMGTTLTAALGTRDGLTLAHIGDSRAYLLHDGMLRQVTTDHSLVAELVRDGRITAKEATVHPYRSVVTRALGVDEALEVDIISLRLVPGDRVLLCSDGLTTMLPDSRIKEVLATEADPTRAANRLVDLANEAGGEDNITVVVVDVADDEPFRPATRGGAHAATGVAARSSGPRGTPGTAGTFGDPSPVPTGGRVPHGELPGRRRSRDRLHRPAGLALRALWVAIPVMLVLGVAFAATAYYARRTYFVAFDPEQRVTVYQGRPSGLLWWDETVRERTGLARDELTDAAALRVERTPSFARLGDAVAFVGRLDRRSPTPAVTASGPSTSSTMPAASTTSSPGPPPGR